MSIEWSYLGMNLKEFSTWLGDDTYKLVKHHMAIQHAIQFHNELIMTNDMLVGNSFKDIESFRDYIMTTTSEPGIEGEKLLEILVSDYNTDFFKMNQLLLEKELF